MANLFPFYENVYIYNWILFDVTVSTWTKPNHNINNLYHTHIFFVIHGKENQALSQNILYVFS